MHDEGFGSWDGGYGGEDLGFTSVYDSVGYEATEGGGTIFILPNGEPAREEYTDADGGELDSGPGTAYLESFPGLLEVSEEAGDLLESALVEGSGVDGNEILDVEPAEENEPVGEGVPSATPTPTPGPVVVYYEDPRLDDLNAVLAQIDQRDSEIMIHYHNMEVIGTSLVGLLAMLFGGCVCYAFLRRILT